MPALTLDSALAPIIGQRTAKAIERAFGYSTVLQLLEHYPRRYYTRGELTPISSLIPGQEASIVARVVSVTERHMRQRTGTLQEVTITDGHGRVKLTFFNQPYRVKQMRPGTLGMFAGKVTEFAGQLQVSAPEFHLFAEEGQPADEDMQAWAERPVAVYPASGKVPTWVLARSIGLVLAAVREGAPELFAEPLPEGLVTAAGIMPYAEAMRAVHEPADLDEARRARDSLRFREAFELQLLLGVQRGGYEAEVGVARPGAADGVAAAFDAALPFSLTGEQREVGEHLARALSSTRPMHALLQGEVGSGKTLVATRAMLQVVDAGGQAALLAPTEVLAAQHLHSLREMLGEELTARVRPVLLTGRMSKEERRRVLLEVASGTAGIVVGTHALMSRGVSFADLGLVVIDEQHRFGVEQREALREKGRHPHVLAMTATPIPRTIALTAFGDLEVLTLRELPPGRQGISTFVVPEAEQPQLAARGLVRVEEELAAGRQVYVVCPAISPRPADEVAPGHSQGEVAAGTAGVEGAATSAGQSEADPLELPLYEDDDPSVPKPPPVSVEETFAQLSRRLGIARHGIAVLHGALPQEEKERVMREFAAGRIGTLVCTTVIEVGVNVPNATMLLVRDADRFGISQLHQLRGRVGRGELPGLCLLFTQAPQGTPARERLDAVAGTIDGFELAERDLAQRREGDILGTTQSGGKNRLKLLRVTRDGEVIERAHRAAAALLQADAELADYPLLRERLERLASEGGDNLGKS